jgi:hypothetical protein
MEKVNELQELKTGWKTAATALENALQHILQDELKSIFLVRYYKSCLKDYDECFQKLFQYQKNNLLLHFR